MTRKNTPADPTAEGTADQSTPANSGLGGGAPEPDADSSDEDLIARKRSVERRAPRQYEADEDAAMPTNDATLNTKI